VVVRRPPLADRRELVASMCADDGSTIVAVAALVLGLLVAAQRRNRAERILLAEFLPMTLQK